MCSVVCSSRGSCTQNEPSGPMLHVLLSIPVCSQSHPAMGYGQVAVRKQARKSRCTSAAFPVGHNLTEVCYPSLTVDPEFHARELLQCTSGGLQPAQKAFKVPSIQLGSARLVHRAGKRLNLLARTLFCTHASVEKQIHCCLRQIWPFSVS
jgi:hypothetical protein